MIVTGHKWVYIRVNNTQMCMFRLSAMSGVFLNDNKIEILFNDAIDTCRVLNFEDKEQAAFIYEELMAAPIHDEEAPPKYYKNEPGHEGEAASIFIGGAVN